MYVYIQLIHFAVQQKLHNIVKQLYSNKNVKNLILTYALFPTISFYFPIFLKNELSEISSCL